jgi:hypothetical protein
MFGVFAVITEVVCLVTGRSVLDAVSIAFVAFSGLVLVLFAGTWLVGLNIGGRVLLDCGPRPTRGLSLLCAALFMAGGAMIAFRAASKSGAFAVTAPLFLNSFSIYYLIMASNSFQVREKGLWGYWGLVRWSEIASFRWADDSTLVLTGTRPLSFLRSVLPVPREYHQEVERLMLHYCEL